MRHFLVGLATLWGIGRCPVASGTAATLLPGVPVALIIAHMSEFAALITALLIIALGTLGSQQAIRSLGREDPREVVVDELAGYVVTMLWLPPSWLSLTGGFLLFRLFDIWKPWPVRWVDAKVKGGLGVMLDDVLAGMMAHFLLWALLHYVP